MYLTKIISIIGIILVLSTANAFSSGTTAADFLNIGVSAHQEALGGSGDVLASDISSAFVNPAGLSFIERAGATFMHNIWYQDVSYEYLGAAMPVNARSTIGISAVYLHMGKIDAYNAFDQEIGTIAPYSLAAIASYSHKIRPDLSLGINAKIISEKLADQQSNGYAIDLGGQYLLNNFSFGLAINNLGPSMKYESENYKLPTAVSFGVGYAMPTVPISILMGARKATDQKVSLATGIEYTLNDYLSLRSGYGAVGETEESSNFNLGAGFKFSAGVIDYAFNPGNHLGATHTFSFTYSFGRQSAPLYSSRSDYSAKTPIAENVTQPAPQQSQQPSEKSDKLKKTYIVSAGKFNNPVSAQSQLEMFKKLGVKGKSELTGDGQYRVVLARTDKLEKAQKIRRNASDKGLVCNIETE
jgi:hypothetical protein